MRILVGGTVAAVLVVVVGVFAFGGGGVSLADAAERMQGVSLRANVTMEIEGAPAMKGTLLQSADLKRLRMEFEEQTIVAIGDDSWTGGSAIEAGLPEGKRWIHDPEGGLTANGSMSFGEFLAALEDASDVEKRGETEIGGQRVTHYVGSVDLEAVNEATGQDGPAMMPLECWIDESGMPVRIKTGMTVEGSKVTMTVDNLEFDVPTDAIQAPPEDETVPASEYELSEG